MHGKHPDQRYLDLAQKWVEGTITNEERAEYIAWLKESPGNISITDTSGNYTGKFDHQSKLFKECRRRIELETSTAADSGISDAPPSEPASVPARSFYRLRVAAVAAIVTGICILGYFTIFNTGNRQSPEATSVIQQKPVDVAAGTTGAVLTLANGKVIILDTAANGSLATQVLKNQEAVVFDAESAGGPVQYHTLTTPRARQQQLVLPDGSRIWLNAESSVRFPTAFTGKTREIELKGEAYFEVAPDKAKPFIVNLDKSSVTVLGTHFNVMAYPEEKFVETTLLEGAVKFHSSGGELLLKPGQQSRMSATLQPMLEKNPDIELVMAWKNGFQSFRNADLAYIFRQIRRWYDVEVNYEDSIPGEISFSGDIPREVTLQQLLKALESRQIKFSLDASSRTLNVQFTPAINKP